MGTLGRTVSFYHNLYTSIQRSRRTHKIYT